MTQDILEDIAVDYCLKHAPDIYRDLSFAEHEVRVFEEKLYKMRQVERKQRQRLCKKLGIKIGLRYKDRSGQTFEITNIDHNLTQTRIFYNHIKMDGKASVQNTRSFDMMTFIALLDSIEII